MVTVAARMAPLVTGLITRSSDCRVGRRGYHTPMATTNGPGLVELLLQDHGEAKRMLAGLEELPTEDRAARFRQVVRALVAHEVAEETVVFPALRDCAAGGGAIVHDRLEEQKAAERLLADLERTPVDDPTFESTFRKLRTAVLEHADAEERTVFWVLSSNLAPSELAELGSRYQQVKGRAPTHAHPMVPDTPPGEQGGGTHGRRARPRARR